jgi:hypothetical protein
MARDQLLGHLGHELLVGQLVGDQVDLDLLALLLHRRLEAGDLRADGVDVGLLGLHDRDGHGAVFAGSAAAAAGAGAEPDRDGSGDEGRDHAGTLHCDASLRALSVGYFATSMG